MNSMEKDSLDKARKEVSLKNMYFNRYLLVRYVSAAFFFANLYWLLLSAAVKSYVAILPVILLIAMIFVIAEQVGLYHEHKSCLRKTIIYFKIQIVVNICVLVSLMPFININVLPFIAKSSLNLEILIMVIGIGVVLSLIILSRLKKIKFDRDKHLGRIRDFEKII